MLQLKDLKKSPSGFFDHLETILADPIIVRSRDDEPVELQRGSNGIDYAGKIHSEMLRRFRAIKVARMHSNQLDLFHLLCFERW